MLGDTSPFWHIAMPLSGGIQSITVMFNKLFANVSGRVEKENLINTCQAGDANTVVASANAYIKRFDLPLA